MEDLGRGLRGEQNDHVATVAVVEVEVADALVVTGGAEETATPLF